MDFDPLPFGAIAIRVQDVAEARKALEEAGVEVKGETWDSAVCHGAAFTDPDGNGLLIHHRYAPYLDGSLP
jgi:predicted enzyme related to lactoylglutathione lyase